MLHDNPITKLSLYLRGFRGPVVFFRRSDVLSQRTVGLICPFPQASLRFSADEGSQSGGSGRCFSQKVTK